MPPKEWYFNPSTVLSGLLVVAIIYTLLDAPSQRESRLRTLEVSQATIRSRLATLEAKKIPPDVQLAFNQQITKQVDDLEQIVEARFDQIEARLSTFSERIHQVLSRFRLSTHEQRFDNPDE